MAKTNRIILWQIFLCPVMRLIMIITLGLIEVYNVSSANNPVSQGDYLQRASANDASGSGLKAGFNGACFRADSVAVFVKGNTRRNFLLCVRWDNPLCFVVRSHKGLQDVEVPNRLALREISPHTCLQSHVEPLDDAHLRFFVVRRNVMHTVLF